MALISPLTAANIDAAAPGDHYFVGSVKKVKVSENRFRNEQAAVATAAGQATQDTAIANVEARATALENANKYETTADFDAAIAAALNDAATTAEIEAVYADVAARDANAGEISGSYGGQGVGFTVTGGGQADATVTIIFKLAPVGVVTLTLAEMVQSTGDTEYDAQKAGLIPVRGLHEFRMSRESLIPLSGDNKPSAGRYQAVAGDTTLDASAVVAGGSQSYLFDLPPNTALTVPGVGVLTHAGPNNETVHLMPHATNNAEFAVKNRNPADVHDHEVLENVAVHVRSSGTNASSSVDIELLLDGVWNPTDWVVSTAPVTGLTAHTGVTVLHLDKAAITGPIGIGHNKDGYLFFTYVGDATEGQLTGVNYTGANNANSDGEIIVNFAGTNQAVTFANKAAVTTTDLAFEQNTDSALSADVGNTIVDSSGDGSRYGMPITERGEYSELGLGPFTAGSLTGTGFSFFAADAADFEFTPDRDIAMDTLRIVTRNASLGVSTTRSMDINDAGGTLIQRSDNTMSYPAGTAQFTGVTTFTPPVNLVSGTTYRIGIQAGGGAGLQFATYVDSDPTLAIVGGNTRDAVLEIDGQALAVPQSVWVTTYSDGVQVKHVASSPGNETDIRELTPVEFAALTPVEQPEADSLEIVRYTADGAIQDKDHRAIFEAGAVNMTLAASTTNRLIQMVSEGPVTIITANGAEEFTSSGGTSTDQKLTINETFKWATIIGRTAGGWSQYLGQVGLPAGVDESTPTKFKAGTRLVQNGIEPATSGTVTFPEAFKAGTTPTVMILPHAPGDNSNVTLQSVSETGFVSWIVRNESDVGHSKDIHWLAIGEQA